VPGRDGHRSPISLDKKKEHQNLLFKNLKTNTKETNYFFQVF